MTHRGGLEKKVAHCNHRRTRRGGGGGLPPPSNFSNSHFRAKKKNHVIFGQNHLIFGQAMEKIFGQLTSAPLNKTSPVRLYDCNLK